LRDDSYLAIKEIRIKMLLIFEKTKKTAALPKYATEGAACFDFCVAEDTKWVLDNGVCTAVIETGLKVDIPRGYRLDLYVRSGLAFKYNITLANGVGKIDEDYKGEIMIKLIAFTRDIDSLPRLTKGTRVAQGELNRVIRADIMEGSVENNTSRGTGGMGSTGMTYIKNPPSF